MVPNNPAAPVTLQQAIDGEPALKDEIKADDRVARLVDISKCLEGLYRHASTHAAGVVISPYPLHEICPMVLDTKTKNLIGGLEMQDMEDIGMIKFDVLGVAMLDKIMGVKSILQKGDV